MRGAVPHIAVMLLLLAGCGSGDGGSAPVMDERTPLPQEATERVFAEGTFEIVDTLKVDDPTFTPTSVTLMENGDLLTFDKGSYQLLRIDSDTGRIVARYGTGAGSGPGEHLVVDGMGEFESGRIWSYDQRNNAVNVFHTEGKLNRRIALEGRVQMLQAHSVDRLIGLNIHSDFPFTVYDSDGRSTGGYGWLLDEPGLKSLAYIGRMIPLPDGGIVYVVMNADLVKSYDPEGKLVWYRRLIDRRGLLDVVPNGDGSYGLDYPEDETISRLPMNAWENRFHVIVVGHSEDFFFVDTYSASDGSYFGTRRFPMDDRMCGPRFIAGATAWMICDGTTLVRARIPEL